MSTLRATVVASRERPDDHGPNGESGGRSALPAGMRTPGPVQFDGNYLIAHLPVGKSYAVYAEPLDGAVAPSEVSNALVTVCRNATTDPGWPPAQGCVVPPVNTQFTTRVRPED